MKNFLKKKFFKKKTFPTIILSDAMVDQDAGLLGHLHHKKHSDLIAPKCEGPFVNSGGPRYALCAWTRFELLGALLGPGGDRTSADDLHLNFTNI